MTSISSLYAATRASGSLPLRYWKNRKEESLGGISSTSPSSGHENQNFEDLQNAWQKR
jgi:hypothetical protein